MIRTKVLSVVKDWRWDEKERRMTRVGDCRLYLICDGWVGCARLASTLTIGLTC